MLARVLRHVILDFDSTRRLAPWILAYARRHVTGAEVFRADVTNAGRATLPPKRRAAAIKRAGIGIMMMIAGDMPRYSGDKLHARL